MSPTPIPPQRTAAQVIQIEQARQAHELDDLKDEDRALARMIQRLSQRFDEHVVASNTHHTDLRTYFAASLDQRTESFRLIVIESEKRTAERIENMSLAIAKQQHELDRGRQRDARTEREIDALKSKDARGSKTEEQLAAMGMRTFESLVAREEREAELESKRKTDELERIAAEAKAARERKQAAHDRLWRIGTKYVGSPLVIAAACAWFARSCGAI